MSKRMVWKHWLFRVFACMAVIFLTGCGTNKEAPKPVDKDITAEERESKRGQ